MKYYLVGYMYSGKTTVGLRLARQLGLKFVDLDQAFEQRYRITVPDFFARYGEEAFRTLERQLLQATAAIDNVVVSTGGGTACQPGNMEFMNGNGTTVFLRIPLDSLLQRAATSHKERPLITNMEPSERRTHIERQLEKRLPFYLQAQITVDADADDPQQVVTLILDSITPSPQTA